MRWEPNDMLTTHSMDKQLLFLILLTLIADEALFPLEGIVDYRLQLSRKNKPTFCKSSS